MDQKSLYIYKSSAGSGKTHTLVKDYLKIALARPDVFRKILAITFTNKAAGEMKERIIENLTEFSNGFVTSALATSLKQELNLSDVQLQKRSRILLKKIINHFDEFNISTIDSFVHRIIRTFSKEIQLPSDFEVVIELDDMIPDLIESIYEKLGEENTAITKLMTNFIFSLTDEEKYYDPHNHLVNYIKKHTEEENFSEIKKLDSITLNELVKAIGKLFNRLNELKSQIQETSGQALKLLEEHQLSPTDFYQGKSGIGVYLTRLHNRFKLDWLKQNSYVLKAINEDVWYSKGKDPSVKHTIDKIKPRLVEFFHQISETGNEYLNLKLASEKIYTVAFFKILKEVTDNYTQTTGKLHISEFNKRISDSIAGQPAPFIFERLGTKLEHFLIDEFQDTSVLQWYNLLPLIENAIAFNRFNMLVGDPKQAIYRFRGGEVELFTSLPKLYGATTLSDKEYREKQLDNAKQFVQLDTNYRSYQEIIHFNNRFFDFIKELYGNKALINKIYQDHRQQVSRSKNHDGYVSIELIESEGADDYENKRLEKIESYVNRLKQKGFSYGDICVLTRTSDHAHDIAEHLINQGIPVLTSESLRVSESAEVRATVSFLKGLHDPNNLITLSELIHNLLSVKNDELSYSQLMDRYCQKAQPDFSGILEHFLGTFDLEYIKQKSIYEMAVLFYHYLNPSGNHNLYFQFFLDFIHEQEQTINSRLDLFIDLWEKKKKQIFIVMPQGEEAVQIMTVHKAKGLKFQVVILDFINRRKDNTKTETWKEIEIPGIPELKTTLFPLTKSKLEYGNSKTVSELRALLDKETEKTELDFINLVYVAFTRPVEALFLLADKRIKKDGSLDDHPDKFSHLIFNFLKRQELYQDNRMSYEFGELTKIESSQQKDDKRYIHLTKSPSSTGEIPIKIAPVDDIFWEENFIKNEKSKGKIVHEILAEIKTPVDIDKVLDRYFQNAQITQEEHETLKETLQKIVLHPILEPYFSDEVIVKTEKEILTKEGAIRPDRVVIKEHESIIIEYKTGSKQKAHIAQLKKYLQAMKALGYSHVKGHLVYLGHDIELITI